MKYKFMAIVAVLFFTSMVFAGAFDDAVVRIGDLKEYNAKFYANQAKYNEEVKLQSDLTDAQVQQSVAAQNKTVEESTQKARDQLQVVQSEAQAQLAQSEAQGQKAGTFDNVDVSKIDLKAYEENIQKVRDQLQLAQSEAQDKNAGAIDGAVGRIGDLQEDNNTFYANQAKYNEEVKLQSELTDAKVQQAVAAQKKTVEEGTQKVRDKLQGVQSEAQDKNKGKKQDTKADSNSQFEVSPIANTSASTQDEKVVAQTSQKVSAAKQEPIVVKTSQNPLPQGAGSNWNIQYN